jgi:hypothetical protein
MRKGFAMCVSAWPILTEARLIHLRKLVEACEKYGVIPIISYQADEYKKSRVRKTKKSWWLVVNGGKLLWQRTPLLGLT